MYTCSPCGDLRRCPRHVVRRHRRHSPRPSLHRLRPAPAMFFKNAKFWRGRFAIHSFFEWQII